MDYLIGDYIKKFRKMKKINQQELGIKLGVSAAMISQWERGKRNPKEDSIKKICVALGITVNDLIITVYKSNEDARSLLFDYSFELVPIEWDVRSCDNCKHSKTHKSEPPCSPCHGWLRGAKRKQWEPIVGKENALLEAFDQLNEAGKKKAVEWVALIAKAPEYLDNKGDC
jgi:transcriptional regulator with XRE-family HTH domain